MVAWVVREDAWTAPEVAVAELDWARLTAEERYLFARDRRGELAGLTAEEAWDVLGPSTDRMTREHYLGRTDRHGSAYHDGGHPPWREWRRYTLTLVFRDGVVVGTRHEGH